MESSEMKEAMRGTHVFTYGSLMFAPVWQRVVTGSYKNMLARLAGHVRHGIDGETYPALVQSSGGEVSGRVYFDVEAADVARLDDFEGQDYLRINRQIELSDGSACHADFYLYQGPKRLTAADWDVQWFESEGIHQFMQTYCAQRGV